MSTEELMDENDILEHYGVGHLDGGHSGRYPFGSGEDPYQHNGGFRGYVNDLKKQGWTEKEIAEGFGMSTTELRSRVSLERASQRTKDTEQALAYKDQGYSNVEIGKMMGINESTVRSLLNPTIKSRTEAINNTADILREAVSENNYIDVGVGTELYLGVKRTKLKAAIAQLEDEGYKVYYSKVEQMGTGESTSLMVLCPPGTDYKEFINNQERINIIDNKYTDDDGLTYTTKKAPENISSDRIYVRYAEQGGTDRDGVIELRRNVEDLDLGSSRYAQVRIGVDGTHYLKGMAMYSDDIPDGYDIVFNTNKHEGTPVTGDKDNTVLKLQKNDEDNPFGASITRQSGALNIVNEEGDWNTWSRNLASQMLSKQPVALAKKQLDLAYADKQEEYDEIMSLTNPVVQKKLLESFADGCDAASVNLKAAALPRQASKVILPFPDMNENEIYAPTYNNGESVVLIRYPHGGKFEIPELTVNNNVKSANSVIHNAIDAVGINPKVAARLSGADFDGDTVLVIPNTGGMIKTASALKGLENFDPKEIYKLPADAPKMSNKTKQLEMGKISNLITDMTLKGANADELCRAVKHSMVVIDAEKHHLDYKQSYEDNKIQELKDKYQEKENGKSGGASTLISKASSEERVAKRKEGKLVTDETTGKTSRQYIDPTTGKKLYEETGESYYKPKVNKKTGEVTYTEVKRTEKSTKMAETEDAFTLSSGTQIETTYAEYANKLKALANTARKSYLSVKTTERDPEATKKYSEEVSTLNAKLEIAQMNAPKERRAQLLANTLLKAKKEANPDMDADDVKKAKGQCLTVARVRTGASKTRINITDKEWEAIQAGAISSSKLSSILNNANLDDVKKLATPRSNGTISDAKLALIKSMSNSGYSIAEIADRVGISTSTVSKYMD